MLADFHTPDPEPTHTHAALCDGCLDLIAESDSDEAALLLAIAEHGAHWHVWTAEGDADEVLLCAACKSTCAGCHAGQGARTSHIEYTGTRVRCLDEECEP